MMVSKSEETVVLVGSPLPEFRRAVERRGLKAIAMTFQQGVETPIDDPVILAREVVDISKTLQVVRRLLELHEQYGFKGIIPIGEFGLLPAAVAAIKLGLPAHSLAAVTATRDKLRMRRAIDRAGLPQPRWAGCESEGEAAAFLRAEDRPIVIKPAWGTGSEAVTLVSEPEELTEAFARIRSSRSAGPVLCEQFVDGPEVSLEAYTVNGRFVPVALTDKLTGPGFVETGHQQPSAHPRELQQEVFSLAEKILAALKLDRTASHTEFRLSAAGPMLIETHTRMGGDWIHLLTAETRGVDLADLTVGLALGEDEMPASKATGRGCAVRFLTGGPGRLQSIEAPVAGGDLLLVHVQARPGDVVEGCRSSLERLAEVVAIGDDAEQAVAAAERHLERIELRWQSAATQRSAG